MYRAAAQYPLAAIASSKPISPPAPVHPRSSAARHFLPPTGQPRCCGSPLSSVAGRKPPEETAGPISRYECENALVNESLHAPDAHTARLTARVVAQLIRPPQTGSSELLFWGAVCKLLSQVGQLCTCAFCSPPPAAIPPPPRSYLCGLRTVLPGLTWDSGWAYINSPCGGFLSSREPSFSGLADACFFFRFVI